MNRGSGRAHCVIGAALLLSACGEAPTSADPLVVVREDPSDAPVRGLDDATMLRFADGDAAFEEVFRASQGLGPVYIRHACASCHASDAKGPGSVTKMVLVAEDGFTPQPDQDALPYGHTLRPQTVGSSVAIAAPGLAGLKITRRIGPAVFARGYLEAIDDSEIERVEAEQALRSDGISGRINRVTRHSETNTDTKYHNYTQGMSGLIGRFGLKARIATLDDFSADALQGDMGVTSPLRTHELPNPLGRDDDEKPGIDVDLDKVNEMSDYVRLLAIPRRSESEDGAGAALFNAIGCAACHVPALRTRSNYPIAPLAGIDAPVFSDLLLHDMGSALADGMVEENAGPREWRTAPLIGLRHLRTYLHDGRAATIEDAVLDHEGEGSEANGVIDQFQALSSEERTTLINYVSAL